MKSGATITAIVPSMAAPERSRSLLRAIDSLRLATTGCIDILVVVNGTRFDRKLIAAAIERGAHVVQVEKPSAPHAHMVGRGHVQTDYFCFLDDDDEYYAGALDRLVAVMDDRPQADAVVANGVRVSLDGTTVPFLAPFDAARDDPLGSVLDNNWLGSCGALFRTTTVPTSLFEDYHPYVEWTLLAYKLALTGKRIEFIDDVLYQINESAVSASRSEAYITAIPALFAKLRALHPPPHIAKVLRRKECAAWHDVAEIHLREGRLSRAWAAHGRSMSTPASLAAYLLVSRHLVAATVHQWCSTLMATARNE